MSKKYESGQAKFLIETLNRDNEVLVRWVLDQRVRNAHDNRCWDSLYNQVQEHLNDLSVRTGCGYMILNWGVPEDVDFYIKSRGLTID